MKLTFWIKIRKTVCWFLLLNFASYLYALDLPQNSNKNFEDKTANAVNIKSTKNVNAKPIRLGIKIILNPYDIDWSTYDVKPGQGVDTKLSSAFIDWFSMNKPVNLAQAFDVKSDEDITLLNCTHILTINVKIQRTSQTTKVHQFSIGADYFLTTKNDPSNPLIKGNIPVEQRSFDASQSRLVPEVLVKSVITISTAHLHKIRQILQAQQGEASKFFLQISHYARIDKVFNIMDDWSSNGSALSLELKILSIETEQVLLQGNYVGTLESVKSILSKTMNSYHDLYHPKWTWNVADVVQGQVDFGASK